MASTATAAHLADSAACSAASCALLAAPAAAKAAAADFAIIGINLSAGAGNLLAERFVREAHSIGSRRHLMGGCEGNTDVFP